MSNISGGKKTRNKILLTARNLFYTQGFSNTTYTHIAEAAKVNVGSIAYHFGNLDSLANEIYQEILEERNIVINEKMRVFIADGKYSKSAIALSHYEINTQSYLDYPNYADFISERVIRSSIWDTSATNATILNLCRDFNVSISKQDLELEKYLYIPFSILSARAVNNNTISYTARELCDYQLEQRLKTMHISDDDIKILLDEIYEIASKIKLRIDDYMHIS